MANPSLRLFRERKKKKKRKRREKGGKGGRRGSTYEKRVTITLTHYTSTLQGGMTLKSRDQSVVRVSRVSGPL